MEDFGKGHLENWLLLWWNKAYKASDIKMNVSVMSRKTVITDFSLQSPVPVPVPVQGTGIFSSQSRSRLKIPEILNLCPGSSLGLYNDSLLMSHGCGPVPDFRDQDH